jgi:hypothetical protein
MHIKASYNCQDVRVLTDRGQQAALEFTPRPDNRNEYNGKQHLPALNYYSKICLDRLRKTTSYDYSPLRGDVGPTEQRQSAMWLITWDRPCSGFDRGLMICQALQRRTSQAQSDHCENLQSDESCDAFDLHWEMCWNGSKCLSNRTTCLSSLYMKKGNCYRFIGLD